MFHVTNRNKGKNDALEEVDDFNTSRSILIYLVQQTLLGKVRQKNVLLKKHTKHLHLNEYNPQTSMLKSSSWGAVEGTSGPGAERTGLQAGSAIQQLPDCAQLSRPELGFPLR